MAWVFLIVAGLFEVTCTTVYRYTGGLSRVWPTLLFFCLGACSVYCLNRSAANIPLGTAYAVWTGIGAAGTALIGMMFYDEPAVPLRLALIALLIGSIIGLKLVNSN